jgi:large subunit ribosomal protein L18
MADKNITKKRKAERRRRRIRGKIVGSSERPRLTVRKSLKNVFVQIIDDTRRMTLVGLASNSKAMQEVFADDDNKTIKARKVGMKLAELAKEKGIESVVFDRNRCRYHGRIKAVAEGAREGGLSF